MNLCIIRHGEAGQAMSTSPHADAERELTADGRDETESVAAMLRQLKCHPARIGTSPLPRARQTAEILARELGGDLEVCGFLAPGADADAEAALRWLRARAGESAMVVGHMPDLADMASACLSKKGALDIAFKKSGVCLISFDGPPKRGGGRLEWLVQPKMLRNLCRRKKGADM